MRAGPLLGRFRTLVGFVASAPFIPLVFWTGLLDPLVVFHAPDRVARLVPARLLWTGFTHGWQKDTRMLADHQRWLDDAGGSEQPADRKCRNQGQSPSDDHP